GGGGGGSHTWQSLGVRAGRVDHVAVVEAVCAHGLNEHGAVDTGRRHDLEEVLDCNRRVTEPVEAHAGGMKRVPLCVFADDVDVRIDDHTVAGIQMPYRRAAFFPSTLALCSASRASRSRRIRTV